MKHQMIEGFKYFIVMVAAARSHLRVRLINSRTEVQEFLLDSISLPDRKGSKTVKSVHVNSAPECLALHKLFMHQKIYLTTFSAYDPQPNGLTEGINERLLGKAPSLMKHAGISGHYCGERLMHATHMYRITATLVLNMTRPYKSFCEKASKNASRYWFGFAAFTYNHESWKSDKFDRCAEVVVCLGNRDYMYSTYIPYYQSLVFTTRGAIMNKGFLSLFGRQGMYIVKSDRPWISPKTSRQHNLSRCHRWHIIIMETIFPDSLTKTWVSYIQAWVAFKKIWSWNVQSRTRFQEYLKSLRNKVFCNQPENARFRLSSPSNLVPDCTTMRNHLLRMIYKKVSLPSGKPSWIG